MIHQTESDLGGRPNTKCRERRGHCQVIRGASAFSDSGEYFEHQMKSDGAGTTNFIPSRDSSKGFVSADVGVKHNMDIFLLPPEVVPSSDQIKEIWFAFNTIVNYICNKNLRPGGDPRKFITWIETARRAYPTNPVMLLFMAIGHRLLGEDEAIVQDLLRSTVQCADNDYWSDRFEAFRLNTLLRDFPASSEAVYASLETLRLDIFNQLDDWMTLPRGDYPSRVQPTLVG